MLPAANYPSARMGLADSRGVMMNNTNPYSGPHFDQGDSMLLRMVPAEEGVGQTDFSGPQCGHGYHDC
jgi:hypothetical protein